MDLSALQPWEALMKRMVWSQLGDVRGQRILDFGSGLGLTADYLAERNEVIAVEPSDEAIAGRSHEHEYVQLRGSVEQLKRLADESFDIIICHNVLEYAEGREAIVGEFERLLKADGYISLVKHNRAGRVMQMAVLLNDFERAHALLDGCDDLSADYGGIRYYCDSDIARWRPKLVISKVMGMRTFWDLQQHQDVQRDAKWQDDMLRLEMRVSSIKEYIDIAFFHHLIVTKRRA